MNNSLKSNFLSALLIAVVLSFTSSAHAIAAGTVSVMSPWRNVGELTPAKIRTEACSYRFKVNTGSGYRYFLANDTETSYNSYHTIRANIDIFAAMRIPITSGSLTPIWSSPTGADADFFLQFDLGLSTSSLWVGVYQEGKIGTAAGVDGSKVTLQEQCEMKITLPLSATVPMQ